MSVNDHDLKRLKPVQGFSTASKTFRNCSINDKYFSRTGDLLSKNGGSFIFCASLTILQFFPVFLIYRIPGLCQLIHRDEGTYFCQSRINTDI